MKNLLLIAFLISCFSCTKTATEKQPEQPRTTNNTLSSNLLVKNLGSTVLTITLDPDVVCYSAERGQPEKPCRIFVDVTCKLSNPVNRVVQVTLQKMNKAQDLRMGDNTPVIPTAGAEDEGRDIVFTIAPNTTSVFFTSSFTNSNNINIPDGQYRIINAVMYSKVY